MYKGEALTQPPPIADWSAAVAEEEQQQQGYYTDSMVSGRRHSRGSHGYGRGARKSSLSGSYRDLGKFYHRLLLRFIFSSGKSDEFTHELKAQHALLWAASINTAS